MNTRLFKSTLETHGIDREVSDAIVDLVAESREPFVTNERIELEMTKQASDLKLSFAGIETRFEAHKPHMTRLVLGTSGALGLLMIMLRLLPA